MWFQKIKAFFSNLLKKKSWPPLIAPVEKDVSEDTVALFPDGVQSPPWLDEAKKMEGKKETDPELQKVMIPLWRKLFNRSFKSITVVAWCGLGAAAALFWAGLPVQPGGEMARNWGKYGVSIDYKTNGAPKGAIVWINHSGKCGPKDSGNHVTQMNGDCTAEDLLKKDATFDGYGANQGNAWKVSTYSASDICAVRWVDKEECLKVYPDKTFCNLPAKVTKSNKCTSSSKKEPTK